MAKFLALGRGGDFCRLSVCHKPKKNRNLSTGFTENEIRITLLYISFILLTTQQKSWILLFLNDTNSYDSNSYVPNKVTKVLFLKRNLCKAVGKIMAPSARWKMQGQGPGTEKMSGKCGVWKTWGVDNTGPKWKTRGVWKKQNKKKTVFVNKYLPYQWLWTKIPTATCEPAEIAT